MEIERIRSIYFLGIGGIGMSALARYFHHRNVRVSGYDKTPTVLTEQLIREGIPVHFIEDIHQIPGDLDLAVYTPAIPLDHKEFDFLRSKSYPLLKRSEVLGLLTKGFYTVAIAGTHGKTTITSMISHILKTAGRKVTAFIGGITNNYHSNLLDEDNAEIMVVEADEFDRSFLRLNPDMAVISALDADHLDIYGSFGDMVKAYQVFVSHIGTDGALFVNHSIRDYFPFKGKTWTVSPGSPEAMCSVKEIRNIGGRCSIDVELPGRQLMDVILGIPGHFNIENSLFAISVCTLLGVEEHAIREGLRTFKGVQRRFDFRIADESIVYIDDYAHHPIELKACIRAVREIYPNRKITGVFQPHLYSRTRDFSDEFADSLGELDEVILLDIYPAREKPIQGVCSGMLLKKINLASKRLCQREKLVDTLDAMDIDILLTLGAGDIDQMVEPVEKMLNEKRKAKSEKRDNTGTHEI